MTTKTIKKKENNVNYADKNTTITVVVASKQTVHSRVDLLEVVLSNSGIHEWLHDFLRPIHTVVVIQHHQVYSHGVVISYPLRQIAAKVFAPNTRCDLTSVDGWSWGWRTGRELRLRCAVRLVRRSHLRHARFISKGDSPCMRRGS